jgi:hypothetical protein
MITTVPSSCFDGCSSLRWFVLPNQATQIGIYAFNGCTNLSDLILSPELTTLSSYCFANCKSLKRLEFNEKLTTIESYVFSYATVEELIFPNVTSIGDRAFEHGTYVLINFEDSNNLTTYPSYCFASATIGTIIFSKSDNCTLKNRCFESAKVENMYFTGKRPSHLSTAVDNYSAWNMAIIDNIIITDFDNWLNVVETNEDPLLNANKYLRDENRNPITSLTLNGTGNWHAARTQKFREITHLYLEGTYKTINNYAFEDCTALEYVYFNLPITASLTYNKFWLTNAGTSNKGIILEYGPLVEGIPAYGCYNNYVKEVNLSGASSCTAIGKYGFSTSYYL